MPLSVLILIAFLVNIPLGYQRSKSRRLSWQWFVWIHLSIPFIAAARIFSGYGFSVIPWLIAAAITGQLIGGWLRKRQMT